jgi:hypothetical protein
MTFKLTLVLFLIFVISGCSSHASKELGCNFISGSNFTEYDKDSSWGNNIATDIIVGLLNVTLQSTHRNISPDTYTSCAKPDDTICIDSEGNIKEECVLKK